MGEAVNVKAKSTLLRELNGDGLDRRKCLSGNEEIGQSYELVCKVTSTKTSKLDKSLGIWWTWT